MDTKAIETAIETIASSLKEIRQSTSGIETDLIRDRERFEDRFNKLETALREAAILIESIRAGMPTVKTEIQDASLKAVRPVTEAVANLNATIKGMNPLKKENFLKKLFKGR